MIYKCDKCQKTKQIVKATLKEVEGKIVTIEALCDCGEYMKVQVPKGQGMPTIIRNENDLDKAWKKTTKRLIKANNG